MSRLLLFSALNYLFSALNYLFSALCYLKTAFLLANHNREIFSCILLGLKMKVRGDFSQFCISRHPSGRVLSASPIKRAGLF